MVRNNESALGVIFPNFYDELVPELTSQRSMASIPFASRYRMIDFVLSSMVHSGIDNISILVRENYHSLMDHLGAGREWDLTRKNGGLTVWPPYAEKTMSIYRGRVDALAHIVDFLKYQKEKYVILTDTNIAATFDFRPFIKYHIESGATVTCAYTEQELPERKVRDFNKSMFYTFDLDADNRVTKLYINPETKGVQNFGMNIYCIDREFLVELVRNAYTDGYTYFERDILSRKLDEFKVMAYKFDGYFGRITDMKSYFDQNLRLLQDEALDGLFNNVQVYTKLRDDNPTRYIAGSSVKNVMAADGCVIEGEAENCILFRGVKIGKGAVVKNCVLMQDTVVEAGAKLDYVITDKEAKITADKEVKGTDTFPVYVAKHQVI